MLIIFLFVILILLIPGCKFSDCSFSDYMAPKYTNTLKGIGIYIVFFNHVINDYLDKESLIADGVFNSVFILFVDQLTQLMVGMFLFFSGFGIAVSYLRKGKDYVCGFPCKRLLSTILNFDIAVTIYCIVKICIEGDFSIINYLYSLIAWESIGNSNWYIFAIMFCYIVTYLAWKITNNHAYSIYMILLMSFLYYFIISHLRPNESWWYATIFCYIVGYVFGIYRQSIYHLLCQRDLYVKIIIVLIAFIVITFCVPGVPSVFNCRAILWVLLLCCLCRKFFIYNKYLEWAGNHLFPLYIYQRLPMIVLSSLLPNLKYYPVLFIVLCLIITLIIAKFFPVVNFKIRNQS